MGVTRRSGRGVNAGGAVMAFFKEIRVGSRVAIISANQSDGPFSTRLYVNNGETATLIYRKAKTLAGAEKQAREMVRQSNPRRANPGAELLVMGVNPHRKKKNPLRMVNSHFSTEEKMALGRLGIPWSKIQTPADCRKARKALATMEKARKQFGAGAGRGRYGNPHPSAATAQEIYSGFHDVDPEFVDTTDEPHIPAGNYAEMGRLVNIGFKPTAAANEPYRQVYISRGESVRVLSAPGRRQIYFAAGNQEVSEKALAELGCGSGDLCEMGEALQIVYIAKKYHPEVPENARGKIVEWEHDFGEEDGIRPTLFYSRSKRRLLLRGGNYKIENVGIVN